MDYQLRPYQRKWIDDISSMWSKGNRRVLAQLACGGGKTVCFAFLAQTFLKRGFKVLVIAHRVELIHQAASKLEEVTHLPIGIIKADIKPNPDAPIQIASIQTLARRKSLPENVGLLIFDEAHHTTATSYRRIVQHYQKALILGVTATPQRIDGQGFHELFDELVVGASTEELIQNKYLSHYRLFATNQTINTEAVLQLQKTYGRDFNQRDLALAVTTQISVEDIYQNYRKFAPKKRTIIYAASVSHSQEIAAYFSRQGVKAEHIDGNTPTSERLSILERFRSGATLVLCNYEILTEGFDCPDTECVYCVRPTQSMTLWLQMVGRVLRMGESASIATIIDMTENWKVHGLPDDKRVWGLDATSVTQKGLGAIECPSCTHIFRPLQSELEPIYAEVDENGLLLNHHEANCPCCGASCAFTTKETQASEGKRTRVRLKLGLLPDIEEINLATTPIVVSKVYSWLKETPHKSPEQAYRAIYQQFIELIDQFTLGDWRQIVKWVDINESNPTLRAWGLYCEGLIRHKNRQAALAALAKRKPTEAEPSSLPKQTTRTKRANPPLLGNPKIHQQYTNQWREALENCAEPTRQFLSQHGGLFSVQIVGTSANISIEIENDPTLKPQIRNIKEAELQKAFGTVFQKKVDVMFRVAR